MRNEGRMTVLVSIASVLLMMSTSFAAFTSFGDGPRNPGLDVAVTDIKTHKDIDDPVNGGNNPYPPETCTTVTATVKNTGDLATASGFTVQMNVGRGNPVKTFQADAEGGALPSGWSVTDFTNGRWHITTKTSDSTSHSAWCGPDGDAGVQYGVGWEEVMDTANSITVPSTNPMLRFNTLYVTKFATDGGYVEIQDTSLGGDVWDQSGPTTWQFQQGSYDTTTATINPLSKDTKCFGGDSNGWKSIAIDLSNYAGKDIKIRFAFSSSSTVSGTLSGWFIDDVVVTDGTNTQFSDDFESGIGQWTAINLLGETPTAWGVLPYPNQNYNTSSTMCFSNTEPVVNNSYYDGEDSALVTSTIPLTGYTNARLHFWTKIVSQTANDGGFIEVQKGAGEWVYLKPFMKNYCSTLDPDSPYGSAGAYSDAVHQAWTYETFDLSAFAGSNIKIRFHFYANTDGQVNTGWFIDELTIIAWNFQQSDSKQVNVASLLSPGETTDVTFMNVDTTLEGYYLLNITSLMPGDTKVLNDMSYVIIEVRKVINQSLSVVPSQAPAAHGRTTNIAVTILNTGNMKNDVNLQNSTLPPYWNVTFDRKNPVSVNAGASVLVNMSVTNPVNASSAEYVFNVTGNSVTDPTKSASQKVTITVYNNPPTADILAVAKGRVYNPMPFDGSLSSDPEQDLLNYSWDFGDGTAGYGEWINHSFMTAGYYNVTLTVYDGGPLSSDSASQIVNISDDSPVANIDIDTVANNGTYQRNTAVTFNGTRSRDEAPGLLNFTWDFGDDSDVAYDPIVSHNYTTGGSFDVTLTVTDPGGQTGVAFETVRINNPPVAHIASPLPNATFYTTDVIVFDINGSYDPDSDLLTFQWTTNQLPGELLSTSALFSKALNITGYHIITLTVYDGKGVTSYGIDQVTIWVQEKVNLPPKLESGSVDPQTGDEGVTAFRYTVRYSDPNDDVPDYVQVVIDGNYNNIHPMLAVDPLDNNYTDGKDFYFCTTALKGEDSPHNYTFITADRHGSGMVQTDVYIGPIVSWVRNIDSYTNVILGKVYQTGPYHTYINALNNVTPPDIPAGTLSLGVVFAMNTTAPVDRWSWANITLTYSSFNYSKINESTLRLYWSVDGGPWTVVPGSGLDIESQILWMNITRSTAKFAVFGNPAPVGPVNHGKNNQTAADNSMLYLGIGAAVIAILVVVVAAVYLRRRPVIPPEPEYQRVEEGPVEPRKDRKWAKTEDAARPDAMVGTTGEEVKVFRPAGGEVKVFRPGGDEKIFKPAETEEEEKIFRPGANEEVDERAREPPVVDEEAPREKVVEYTEGGEEEQQSSMPGARPAGQEVERSEETESAAAPRGPETASGSAKPAKGPVEERLADKARTAEKKTEDESLDELLDDLNK